MRIDLNIRGLVACLNTRGFKTYACCEGHGFPMTRLKPYVAFKATSASARALAQCLRTDAESISPRLKWGWEVEASFDSHFALCYRLEPTHPHAHWHRYWRKSLIDDFGQICCLLKQAL